MWTDAVYSKNFYASTLGAIAQRMMRRRIRTLWPDVSGMEMLGIGFATPYLGFFHGEARTPWPRCPPHRVFYIGPPMAMEEIGHCWFPAFAGVTIIEATKQIYARHTQAKHERSMISLPRRGTSASTRERL